MFLVPAFGIPRAMSMIFGVGLVVYFALSNNNGGAPPPLILIRNRKNDEAKNCSDQTL